MNIYPWNDSAWNSLRALQPRLPHALLLYGAAGIGKCALAEAFAQLLLCENLTRGGDACGRCEGCRWFLAGSHPDFRRVEPEILAKDRAQDTDEGPATRNAKPSTEIKVDQIRALASFLGIGAHRGRKRLVIVHPAEEMNPNAANSLLKALEEPPAGAVFILVTSAPSRLLPTIRSRCVAVPVSTPEISRSLAWLEQEGTVDPGRWLAFAGGAPLLAREYAVRGQESGRARLLKALKLGNRQALCQITTREEAEGLAEILQKHALDQCLASFGLKGKYGTEKGGNTLDSQSWLRCARALGRMRALATHPLNPKLFAIDLLGTLPSI